MYKFLFAASLPIALSLLSGLRVAPTTSRATSAAGKPAAKPTTANAPRAKYEPARGAYLGAALNTSALTGPGTMRDKLAAAMRDWEKQTGRKHAIYVNFLPFPHDDGSFPGWDSDPKGWAPSSELSDAAASVGAAPMITLEPLLPHSFTRGWKPGSPAYEATANYARGAGRWGKPMFIRFGHEMNGSWYPWSEWSDKNRNMKRDPGEETGFYAADYRQAYRNVAAMFRRFAPNAALVWCPNSGLLGGERRDVFRPFYPGDDVVDWVGLDVYERGWTMPMPGARLWGGSFARNLKYDAADDPKTEANESVNFYWAFAVNKKKPMMIAETGTTLSFREDLPADQRAALNYDWKAGYWNANEYGWMQGVYGTSAYRAQPLLHPLDKEFPLIKAVMWFQVAKREFIPAQKPGGAVQWFDNSWADYRIGGGVDENAPVPAALAAQELQLYRRLTASPYFLSSIQR